jgi:hypothetical protein
MLDRNTLEALGQDVRYGWRMLWKNPGITVVALLSLALGIGATTCIFSVIYGVLISPYPYVRANEIWAPEIRDSKNPKNRRGIFLPYEFKELQNLPGVSAVMGTRPEGALLTGDYYDSVGDAWSIRLPGREAGARPDHRGERLAS